LLPGKSKTSGGTRPAGFASDLDVELHDAITTINRLTICCTPAAASSFRQNIQDIRNKKDR
jgi:hypothetical protein